MSLPPQFGFGVPPAPKETAPLQFKKPRKIFGEENKADMKKSSIFFSNPSSQGQQQQQAFMPVNTHQGSVRLEFKKKQVVQGGSNTQLPEPKPQQKVFGLQAPTTSGKPAMYSSMIIKPTSDYKSGGLESMGKFVGQDINNRFGGDKPFAFEGLAKPPAFFETKKSLDGPSSLAGLSGPYGEEKKSNAFESKYDVSFNQTLGSAPKPSYPSQQPPTKLSYTPNFAPEYSANLPTSYGETYSSSKSNEFPMFNALSQGLGISNASTSSSSSTYPSSYKDDKYYLDLGKAKGEQTLGSSGSSSYSSYSAPYTAPNSSFPTPSFTDYSAPSSSSYQPTPSSFSKKTGGYESRPEERSRPNPVNEISLSCKAKKSDFHIGKKLGKGQFGDVFVVKHKATGFICAMKIITKKVIKEEKVEEQLVRELKIQFFLHHKNIVALYGFFQDSESVYLLLELCCEGQLFDIIKKERRLPEDRTSDIVRQVCLGIEAIHREKIIHRDIKPENIILHEGVAKICDFGWAVYRGDGLRTTFCGTPMYTSPQMLRGEKYDEKIDIWAIGILTYELLIGRIPFRIMCEDDLQRILTDQITFPDYVDVSSTAKDFILKVLKRNQNEQYDIEDIINHPFLKEKKKPEEFSMISF